MHGVDAFELGGRQAPLKVRIAAQGARAGAGSVHKNAVKLAAQTLDAVVLLVADRNRVNVGKPGAAHAGREALQTLFVDVKGVKAPRGLHEGPEGKRLAACARAEVADHFTALDAHKARDELAAFVLNVDAAFLIDGPADQARLVREANAVGRKLHDFGRDLVFGKFGKNLLALCLERVDAKVKRSALQRRFKKRARSFAVLRAFKLVEPKRHFGAHFGRSLFKLEGEHIGHGPLFRAEHLITHAVKAVLHGEREKRGGLGGLFGLDGLHAPGDFAVAAQRIENRFGQNRAVAAAELGIGLEKRLHEGVGRAVELQNHRKGAREFAGDEIGDAHLARIELLLTHLGGRALFGAAGAVFFGLTLLSGALTLGELALRLFAVHLHGRKGHLFAFGFHCRSPFYSQQSKTARLRAVSSSVTQRPSTSLTLPEATALTARG